MTTDKAGLTALAILMALTGCASKEVRERNQREGARRAAITVTSDRFYQSYQSCLYQVTGPFASASLGVMQECTRQACQEVAAQPAFAQPNQCRALASKEPTNG